MNLHRAYLDRPRTKSPEPGPQSLGFTLVELLLVIAGGAIIAGLMIPVAVSFYNNQQVDDMANSLKVTLRRARTFAVAQRNDSRYGVRIEPGSFVLFQGASYAARNTSTQEIFTIPSNLNVTSSRNEFVFSKLYGTSTASSNIVITGLGSRSVTLSVATSGKVELE
ncbi:MAG: hypothetical protein ABII13_03730 [Patescibacteria group bacterium]|nr:hypothetical protein [Patescibacteria group bacterium]